MTDIEDELKSSTTCAAFGAGVKLPLGFNGGLRYIVGLSDLSDLDAVELKEGTFQIYIRWTYWVQGKTANAVINIKFSK